jgi:multisubunit Na+/H+ antiporter MnhE subunit
MRATAEVVVWWLALSGLWVLTLATPSAPELVAAGVAAVPCAAAAFFARRAMRGSWRPRAGWLKWWVSVPVAAVKETAAALVTVARHPSAGTFEEVAVPDEPAPEHEARLATATVVVGCTPGTMVVTSPPDEHRLLVHRLLPARSGTLERVTR